MKSIRLTHALSLIAVISYLAVLPKPSDAVEQLRPPATFHQSFDSFSFLDDDVAARFAEPTLEQRKLELVPGIFGQALHNGKEFSQSDLEKTSMSTWDLDPLLEVVAHRRFAHWKQYSIGRMQPYFWGTGRLTGDSGTVSFWAKGARTFPGYLFFQGSSSFGRIEQYLIAIELAENGSLAAYVRDARYEYHRIESAPEWSAETFHHVALVWDRSQGLCLYLDGREIASNWGEDAWWATQMPGLMHFPMSGLTVDELWTFDRALTSREVARLMKDNLPPRDNGYPKPFDKEASSRLKEAFIGGGTSSLPVVMAFDGVSRPVFTERFPEWAGDGCVEGHFVLDGKYELAWPQDYTSFTNILGDSDFHPEKVDFRLPEGKAVNYVTLEGNLTDARLLGGDGDRMEELAAVPAGKQLFFGGTFDPVSCDVYRIPFLKGYGSPPGYEPGLHLALTGDIRIHEAGFYNVGNQPVKDSGSAIENVATKVWHVGADTPVPTDNRCGYAMRAMNGRRDARILALSEKTSGGGWIAPGAFSRINLLSAPWTDAETVRSVEISFDIRGVSDGDFAIVRLHDPGVPARIWNTLVFSLDGFSRGRGVLRIELDCADIKVAPGDRLWLDIAFSGPCELRTGSESTVRVETSPLAVSDGRYAEKALKPARSDFTKIYYWYYPWRAMKMTPDANNPPTFGGFFDIVTYPLIVTRTEPDDFVANAMLELSLIPQPYDDARTAQPSRDSSPELWPPVREAPTDGSPEWAFYMRYYLTRYKSIVDWWAERQNPDGQVGGGWNDDVLFASRLPGVFLYSGDTNARGIFDRIFQGLAGTRMFHDGYCNIVPMDFIHVEDLVRNRYEGLLFDPGEPRKMVEAMRTAWRFGKPEETPVNYIDGQSFKFDRDLVLWYWGETSDYPPYSVKRDAITAKMKEIAPSMDEVVRFRYTEAGMFTDGAYMPGCYDIKRIQVGGGWGPWEDRMTLAVSWEEGGDPAIPKWVETATDTSFVAHIYSYDMVDRDVTARLYRLDKGVYRITLAGEGRDADKGLVYESTAVLGRFSHVTVPVRPGREYVLTVERIMPLPESRELPDLAVAESDTRGKAILYNFGNAEASQVTVKALDSAGRTLGEQIVSRIASAKDFVPGEAALDFSAFAGRIDRIVADPDNEIEEIYEGNNTLMFRQP